MAGRTLTVDIRTECNPYMPPAQKWSAIDCDQDGFSGCDPVGLGSTREAAIQDLLKQLEVA